MRRLAVDASVAVKWLVAETGSDAAAGLLADDTVLIAPDLIDAEVANTLWKKARRGDLTQPAARERLAAFLAVGVERLSSTELIQTAHEWAFELDHPVYDCLYLAAARAAGCPLVTADAAFAAKIGDRDTVRALG